MISHLLARLVLHHPASMQMHVEKVLHVAPTLTGAACAAVCAMVTGATQVLRVSPLDARPAMQAVSHKASRHAMFGADYCQTWCKAMVGRHQHLLPVVSFDRVYLTATLAAAAKTAESIHLLARSAAITHGTHRRRRGR